MENINLNTLVTFHEGRGGRFFNGGHLTFYRVCRINEVNELEELYSLNEDTGNYEDQNGNTILSREDAEKGTGTIDIDGEYNSYHSLKVEDFQNRHMGALSSSDCYEVEQILEFIIGENYKIFREFGLIDEVLDLDSFEDVRRYAVLYDYTEDVRRYAVLYNYNIEKATEDEYINGVDGFEVKHIDNLYYKRSIPE